MPKRSPKPVTPESLRTELDDLIRVMEVGDGIHAEVPPDTLQRLDALLRELSKLGARHTIELGLQTIATATTSLLIRLNALTARELARAGREQRDVRQLTPPDMVIEKILPAMDSVGHLHLTVASTYAKFTHVCDLAERRGQSRPRSDRNEVGTDSRPNGKVQVTARKPGKLLLKPAHRPAARLRAAVP